jgi:hypothetical protein
MSDPMVGAAGAEVGCGKRNLTPAPETPGNPGGFLFSENLSDSGLYFPKMIV